jgi:hypothetical protein
MLLTSVTSVREAYFHDAYVVPVNDIKRTLKKPQTFDLEEEK